MLQNLGGWHLVILLVIVLVLFGASKLPALAKSIGQSARVLKGEMRGMKEDDAAASTDPAPATLDAASTAERAPAASAPRGGAEPAA